MSKLPSFDDVDSNVDEKSDFPSMDELLEEFESESKDDSNNELDDNLLEPNFESDFESFTEVEADEEIDENNWHEEDEEDEGIEEDYVNNEHSSQDVLDSEYPHKDEEIDESIDIQEDDDYSEDVYDDTSSDEPQEDYDNFMGSLLPGMEPESEIDEEPENVEDPNPMSNESVEEESDADEKAKEAFINLKNKIIGLFKRKKDNEPKKKMANKENKKLKSPRKQKAPIKINKKQKIILLMFALLFITLFVVIFVFMKSYLSLEDINTNAKFNDKDFDEKIVVDIENIKAEENKLTATIKNESDISATISSSLTLKEKSFIPFMGNKINCESDIVHIETDGEVEKIFDCNNEINPTKKYKINAEIDKF